MICRPWIEPAPIAPERLLLRAVWPGRILAVPHKLILAPLSWLHDRQPEDSLRAWIVELAIYPPYLFVTWLERLPRMRFTR